MKGRSSMSDQMRLWDFDSGISSPESPAGASPLTLPDGRATGKSSRAPAHASHSQSPERAKASATNAIFGRNSIGSSASFNLNSRLENRLRDAPGLNGSIEFTTTLKHAVTPLGRRFYRLALSARRIDANGCFGWPTPMAGTPARNGNNEAGNNDFSRKVVEIALPWPTPTANEHTRGAGTIRPHDTGIPLTQRVAQMTAWPTPKASDGDGGRTTKTEGGGNSHLPIATREASPRATPSARDWKDSAGMSTTGVNPDGTERARLNQLPRQAQAWSTPRAIDGEKGGLNMSFGTGGQPLPAQSAGMTPHGSPGQTEKPAASRGQLNPVFVGWLQGFPPEWTLAGLAVERKRSRSSRKA